MSNSYGRKIKITISGSSLSKYITLKIKNFNEEIKIDYKLIDSFLAMRRPAFYETDRVEQDDYEILGTNNGYTSSSMIIRVKNTKKKNKDWDGNVRPGHADYTNYVNNDEVLSGGMNSGRMSVVFVILGALCKMALKDCKVMSHISKFDGRNDDSFNNLENDYNKLANSKIAVLNDSFKDYIMNRCQGLKREHDSLGAIIETCIFNIDESLGSLYFDSLESQISHLLFSLGAIKGIEFGLGFEYANKHGSEVIDSLVYENDKVKSINNYNGGLLGGRSYGDPIIFRVIVKPTPTINREVKTINVYSKENVLYKHEEPTDPCIATRLSVIINSLCYYVVLDNLK